MKTARIVTLLAAVLAASCATLAAAELVSAPVAIHITAEDTAVGACTGEGFRARASWRWASANRW